MTTLAAVVDQLKINNEEERQRDSNLNQNIAQSRKVQEDLLGGLSKTFEQFFKAERRDKEGDDLEASREAQGQVTKEGAMDAATGSDIEPLDFKSGSYFAMIAGAIAGLATGLVGAIAGQIALVTGAIGRLFRLDKALAALKNSSKLFQARFMNFISKGGVGKFFKAISTTFTNITKQFKAGFNSLKVAITSSDVTD